MSRKCIVGVSIPTGENGIDVEASHFHVLDAALGQRVQRTLAAANAAAWA
jgi:hypothetical protein